MRNLIVGAVVLAVVVLFGWMLFRGRAQTNTTNTQINTQTSTPRATTTQSGAHSSSTLPVIGSPATADDIVVDSPKQAASVSSPVILKGKARGSWFFEASAPVFIIDTNGHVLGRGTIKATGEWMTTNFVPFTGSLSFTKVAGSEEGAVVFLNDNPSGDVLRQKFWAVPVLFK